MYRFIFLLNINFVFSFLIFFRGSHGIDPDYFNYENMYNMISWGYESDVRVTDYAYILLNELGSNIGLDFSVFLWILGLISILLKSYLVNLLNPRIAYLYTIIYLISAFFLLEMIQIRIALALVFYYVFVTYSTSNRKRLESFFIFISLMFLAYNFHASSVILFIATYFLINYNKVTVVPAFVIILMSVFSGNSRILYFAELTNNQSLINYAYQLSFGLKFDYLSILNPTILLSIIFVIFNLYVIRLVYLNDKERKIVILNINLMIISIVFFCCLSIAPVIAYRISELFRVLVPISSAILIFRFHRLNYGVFLQLIILLCNLLFSYTYVNALVTDSLSIF